ncbi:MAG: SAM-dependent methyltransferase [Halothiobacillus sp. 13-55-253]|nr:MAG: SAM-dependent methyltransferase [Halothiobacillus sp. 13-55-253]
MQRVRKLRPLRLAQALLYRAPLLARHTCVICGHHPGGFLPHARGSSLKLMESLGGVGSNLKAFECPWCGCHDRERHIFMYMTAAGLLPDLSGKHVLRFAPEKRLAPKIQAASAERYIRCDLFPQSEDVIQVDMLNIPFDEASFDLLIANHVLEHVSDDARALQEITRVLKPGGFAILQTPFCAKLHATWEDAGIDNDQARREAYGQEDHVRLYGGNIFQRFSSFGLTSSVKTHAELLPDIDPDEFGINHKEPFFLFQKQV